MAVSDLSVTTVVSGERVNDYVLDANSIYWSGGSGAAAKIKKTAKP